VADSDDWRVTISVTGQAHAGPAQQPGSPRQVEEDIRRQVGRGVAVGAGDAQIFLYAGAEAAARDAEQIARDVLARHGMAAESALHRWHPIEERWETPDVPMPQTETERQAERQRLEDAETAESLATGIAQWQVRVELGSHRQAVALARKLEEQSRPVVRRWKFLIVGASNEDQARELAGQIGREAPPDAVITAEQAGVGWPFMPS
jgi:FMN phosphatase YigB (HAD superfamily)